jgi:urease accessory protein
MKETTVFLILFGASGAALAHPEHAVGGVLHGFAHPFGGVDHLLAMVLVGLWAARRRGWTRLLLPCAFVGGMLAGALLGLAGAPLPAVEPMIMVSIAVFAAALLAAAHVAPAPSAALIALFALFHGYAHLAEIPDGLRGRNGWRHRAAACDRPRARVGHRLARAPRGAKKARGQITPPRAHHASFRVGGAR